MSIFIIVFSSIFFIIGLITLIQSILNVHNIQFNFFIKGDTYQGDTYQGDKDV